MHAEGPIQNDLTSQDYSFAADIWSLGLCVYELACGAHLSYCAAAPSS